MRYLLHHSEATFNTVTKRWVFTLDRRISNPRSIRLNKCVFTAAYASSYPSVVYMRSDALHSMTKTKHTVELKADNHENPSNIIAVLQETHTHGRYAISEKGVPLPVHGHSHVREIDIYFTDGNTVLDGEISAGSGPSGGAADDQTMIDIGVLLILWLDMDYSPLDANSQPVTTVTDPVNFLRNRSPGTAQLFFTASAGDFVLCDVGETKGVCGGPSVSWASMVDGNGIEIAAPSSVHMIVRAPAVSGVQSIISMPGEFFKFSFNQTTLTFKTGNGSQTINNVTFLPSSWWYIECRCHDDDSDGIANFSWRFIDLSDPNLTEITEQTQGHILTSTWTQNWSVSSPSDHFAITLGPLCFMESGNSAKRNTIRDWMLAKYSSAAAEAPAVPPSPATFLVELEVKQSQR